MHGKAPLVGEDGLLEEIERECCEHGRKREGDDEARELIFCAEGCVREMSAE